MNLIILSDTHGLLRPAVLELLQTANAILHAGYINSQAVVDKLASFAPPYVVRGNNDKDWAEAIPHDLFVTLEGVRFYMVHNKKDVPADLAGGRRGSVRPLPQVQRGSARRCTVAQPRQLRAAAIPSGDHPDASPGRRRGHPGGEDHHSPYRVLEIKGGRLVRIIVQPLWNTHKERGISDGIERERERKW